MVGASATGLQIHQFLGSKSWWAEGKRGLHLRNELGSLNYSRVNECSKYGYDMVVMATVHDMACIVSKLHGDGDV